MQLRLAEIVKRTFRNYVWIPTTLSFTVVLIFSVLSANKKITDFEIELLAAYQPVLAQDILAGDTIALKRQLNALVKLGQWNSASIIQRDGITLASTMEKPNSCEENFVVFDIRNTELANICISRNLLSKTVTSSTPVIIMFAVFFFLHYFSMRLIEDIFKKISDRFYLISDAIEKRQKDFFSNIMTITKEEEIFADAFNKYLETEDVRKQESLLAERQSAFSAISKQVAHDIRSPLSTLNIVIETLETTDAEKKNLLMHSIKRINDIANDLLVNRNSSMQNSDEFFDKTEHVAHKQFELCSVNSLVRQLIKEKKIQYGENYYDSFDFSPTEEELFALVSVGDFMRVLSNIFNNSIEACDKNLCVINISMSASFDKIIISIRDNGKGIPENILSKLGNESVTFGKENSKSGFGLGMVHAKQVILSFGGTLKFQSHEGIAGSPGIGTMVTITLPRKLP